MPKRRILSKKSSEAFLNWIEGWYAELPVISFQSLLKDFGPDQIAILSVDVVNGFCKEGNLASPRVAGIVSPIVQLFKKADLLGVRHYVLLQDTHPAHSKEFEIYPPHCIEGTEESSTVHELRSLPHSANFKVITKQTINPGIEKALPQWLQENPKVAQYIVVGDCTDICVYLSALYLKTYSVETNRTLGV
ncbi:MAG TPA: isochorismatase family cysteine hydrolase, partial [Acidobacteriota bacterium]